MQICTPALYGPLTYYGIGWIGRATNADPFGLYTIGRTISLVATGIGMVVLYLAVARTRTVQCNLGAFLILGMWAVGMCPLDTSGLKILPMHMAATSRPDLVATVLSFIGVRIGHAESPELVHCVFSVVIAVQTERCRRRSGCFGLVNPDGEALGCCTIRFNFPWCCGCCLGIGHDCHWSRSLAQPDCCQSASLGIANSTFEPLGAAIEFHPTDCWNGNSRVEPNSWSSLRPTFVVRMLGVAHGSSDDFKSRWRKQPFCRVHDGRLLGDRHVDC